MDYFGCIYVCRILDDYLNFICFFGNLLRFIDFRLFY